MRCSYKPRANSLWCMVYCLLTLLITSYLLYLGIRRYFIFIEYDSPNRWRYDIYSIMSVVLHAVALALLPFFIIACCFKVGNLASDGERLGERTQKILELLAGTPVCRKLKSAWQHGPPVAQTIHLSMAFALLMAHTLMETQFFKRYHGSAILGTEEIWSTDMEFLYNNQDDKVTRLMVDGVKEGGSDDGVDISQNHRRPRNGQLYEYDGDPDSLTSRSRDNREQLISSFDIGPRLLPFLSNFRLYGISLLFINYVIALLAYTCTYPSVYWRASKSFSVIFCCHLLLHLVTSIFAFIGFVILYRFQHSGGMRPPFILDEYFLLGIYVTSCIVLFFASSVIYGYGYNKFCLRLLAMANSGGRGRLSRFGGQKTHPVCCEGYCPHIAAILMLILMVAAKAPILYDLMVLYQKHLKPIVMVCIVVDVVYLFAWILLWLGLTLKREWDFNVRYTSAEIGALLGLQTDEGRRVSDSTLMVVCGQDWFATDNETKRSAMLKLAEKCGLGQHEDEVYWLKPSRPMVTSGKAENMKQNASSPETNALLDDASRTQRPVYHQTPQNKAATIGVSAGNYYRKYSPSGVSGLGESELDPNQKRQLASAGASGSYVRFTDGQSPGYDEQAVNEIVNTFGTLPRQDYPRRRMIHANGADIFTPPAGTMPGQSQSVASVGPLKRTPSPVCPPRPPDLPDPPRPTGFAAYASLQKRNVSPAGLRSPAEYDRIMQGHPQQNSAILSALDGDPESVSLASSYANIPSPSKQSWEVASMNRPPTGKTVAFSPNQQFLQHQHHYDNAGSTRSSPYYTTLQDSTGAGTSGNGQSKGRHYKGTNGLESASNSDLDNGVNGGWRKLSSFGSGGETNDITPTQLGTNGNGTMGATSSSRELTPLGNDKSGIQLIPSYQQQPSWRLNSIYTPSATVVSGRQSNRPQVGPSFGVVYTDDGGASSVSGTNGRTVQVNKDSTGYLLNNGGTEAENNFVTSIV